MIRKLIDSMIPQKDNHGAFVVRPDDHARARKADLIVLPDDVLGKNCADCDYFDDSNSTCTNRALLGIPVNARMACKLWYNKGIYEPWSDQQV